MSKVICDYCGNDAVLVSGKNVYPHRPDLYKLNFWSCDDCNAYVGCHKRNKKLGLSGTEPLGRLADKNLRSKKSEAHRNFDPMWREYGLFKSRKRAYNWLANELKIDASMCHIGMFDIEMCNKVIELCEKMEVNTQTNN